MGDMIDQFLTNKIGGSAGQFIENAAENYVENRFGGGTGMPQAQF